MITDRIVALLEQGTVPWHKPWKARTGLPRNLVSKKPYRVAVMLASNGYITGQTISVNGGWYMT